MMVTEPMTMFTDYVLAGFGVVYFMLLFKSARFASQKSVKLWAFGFLLSAFAAAVGGTFHGFTTHFTPGTSKALWNVTVFLLGSCTAFMISGTLVASIPRNSQSAKWLLTGLAISMLGLVLLASRVSFHEHFTYNDIYHCVQMAGLYSFYRGAKLLQDETTYV
jgi:hypothetical protein